MAIVGRGKIAVWEGAALWLLESAGSPAELAVHAHHAIQVTFALAGRFEIGVDGYVLAGPVTAVAADAPHTFHASGAAAFLFVEPESSPGRTMAARFLTGCAAANIFDGPFLRALSDLQECRERDVSVQDLADLGRRVLAELPSPNPITLPDPRVQSMIEFAHAQLEGTVTLPAAADHVRLSSERARHLFVEQTGLPFKTYVLWLRLERAVSFYAGGSSLTAAAHEAGFADSAHLSRTFRRTFGLPAAALRLSPG